MSTLLEKALERIAALPQDEQDAIASQILASLADEGAWKKRLAEKRNLIRRMAQEALEEDERGEALPLLAPAEQEPAGRPTSIKDLPFYGMWKDRSGIGDGVDYVNKLRDNPRG